jgi:hypothetical protein
MMNERRMRMSLIIHHVAFIIEVRHV